MTSTAPDKTFEFIKRIENLDSGQLAVLRRCAGDRLSERSDALWFLGIIRGTAREDVAFLLATLLAQFSTTKIRAGSHRGSGNFGATWKLAIGRSPSNSIQRRFHILLDSEIDADGGGDLPYRLRQMVRYCATAGVGLDWPQLLSDLRAWNHPDRFVQKRWARSFFDTQADSTEETSNLETEELNAD